MRMVYLSSVWLHLVAAMVWVGGMIVFVAAVMPTIRRLDEPRRSSFMYDFAGYFRRVMWVVLAVMGATGLANLWLRGVRLEHFGNADWIASGFGHFVVAKVVLFCLAVAIVMAHERVESPRTARWLGRLVLTLGLVTVALAVLLVRGG